MNVTPSVKITGLATIVASAVSAVGSFSLGKARETLAIPAACDQVLVLNGTLDSAATTYPGEVSIDLSDGTVASADQPGGFDFSAWQTAIGATGENAEGAAAGFSTIYAIIMVFTGSVSVSSEDWTGGAIEAAADQVNGTHLVMADLAGWTVSAGNSILIDLPAGGEETFEIVILGEA